MRDQSRRPGHRPRGRELEPVSTLAPPRNPPLFQSDRDYHQGLKWSLGLHGGVLALILLKSFVFPGSPVRYLPTLRVDIVGMPDVLKKDLTSAKAAKELRDLIKNAEKKDQARKPKPLPKVELAKPDEMVLHPKKQTPEASKDVSKKNEKRREKALEAKLNRMKALARISADLDEKPAPVIKGNQISKGSSVSGEARESAQASYYDGVLDRLRDNWALPVWLSRQDLSAQVQIFIDAQGRLHDFRFVKFSGNSQFDDAVKRALKESDPFPAPPRELSENVLVNGILFGFPL